MKADEIKDPFPNKSGYLDEHAYSEMKIYGNGRPIRLFVAGMHGDEWKDTTEILKSIESPKTGTLALIPLVNNGKYVSTLEADYYPEAGKKILKACLLYTSDAADE